MKLLLTSSGLDSIKLKRAFVGILKKKVEESKVLVVHTAQEPEHLVFIDEIGKGLSRLGILLPNILYLDIGKQNSHPHLNEFDAVYICGGNTYYILDRMRKSGLASSLKKYVHDGGFYIGVSAGSIIAGPSIEIAGWGSEGDPNDINLNNLDGLNFTSISVFPHYKDKLRNEVKEFKEKVKYPVETLKDGEALKILGKTAVKLI